MSALWSGLSERVGAALADSPAAQRPSLRSVRRPQPRLARLPFVLVLIMTFAVGMTGLLMLNTTLQNQAFVVRSLDVQNAQLGYTEASLQRQVDQLRSPQSLALRATALGMRTNPSPAFLILPSGKIIGEANPVQGNEEPSLVVKTDQQVKAEQAATAARKAAAAREEAEAEAAREQAAEEQAAKEKAVKEKAAKDKTANDQAGADQAGADRAGSDQAGADRAETGAR